MERLGSSPRRVTVVGLPGSGKSTLARSAGLGAAELSGRRSPPADFASGCRERFDRQFLQLLRYVWRYPHTERPTVVASLSALRPDQTLLVARSRSEVERALEVLAGQPR